MARFDARPLQSAILGLYHESSAATDPVAIHHWVELIQTYVLRFAQPWHVDDRLWRLWENPFVFSTTFKKWIGWRPSEYRRRGGN